MYSTKQKKALNKLKDLKLALKRRPNKRDSNSLYYYSRRYFGTWNNLLESGGFGISRHQKPKIPIILTPKLAYFIGLVMTDGHLQIKKTKGRYSCYL